MSFVRNSGGPVAGHCRVAMAVLGKSKSKPETGGRKSDKLIVVRKPTNNVAITEGCDLQRSGWSEVT